MTKLIERVTELLEDPIERIGYELWDVGYQKEGSQWFLRLYIDHLNGITLEDCVQVNKIVEPILETVDLISQEYILEVSSPGVFRSLKKPEHFKRFTGEALKLSLFQAVQGRKKITGRLISASSQEIEVALEDQIKIVLLYQQIAKASLNP
ncbi:MAG: ribosome maturation factor RimP [SAR324 cluster bacterium]|nr:ribosome maturation factor RimP [SAR324 cluster bacterium]